MTGKIGGVKNSTMHRYTITVNREVSIPKVVLIPASTITAIQ